MHPSRLVGNNDPLPLGLLLPRGSKEGVPQSMEVTYPLLVPNSTSLCDGGSNNTCSHKGNNRNTNSLHECLLIKGRWWLVVIPPTVSTSSFSICHLHMSNRKLRFPFSNPTSSTYATTNRPSHHVLTRSSHFFLSGANRQPLI